MVLKSLSNDWKKTKACEEVARDKKGFVISVGDKCRIDWRSSPSVHNLRGEVTRIGKIEAGGHFVVIKTSGRETREVSVLVSRVFSMEYDQKPDRIRRNRRSSFWSGDSNDSLPTKKPKFGDDYTPNNVIADKMGEALKSLKKF